MALSAIIAALIPTVVPEIIKQIKTKPKTFIKEASGIGLVSAITFILQDVEACSSAWYTCVSVDHWSAFAVALIVFISRLNAKRGESEE